MQMRYVQRETQYVFSEFAKRIMDRNWRTAGLNEQHIQNFLTLRYVQSYAAVFHGSRYT